MTGLTGNRESTFPIGMSMTMTVTMTAFESNGQLES